MNNLIKILLSTKPQIKSSQMFFEDPFYLTYQFEVPTEVDMFKNLRSKHGFTFSTLVGGNSITDYFEIQQISNLNPNGRNDIIIRLPGNENTIIPHSSQALWQHGLRSMEQLFQLAESREHMLKKAK